MFKKLFIAAFLIVFVLSPIVVIFYYPALGRLEGRLKPVVRDVELLSAGQTSDAYVTHWKFFKDNECDFIDLTFYEGKRDGVFSLIVSDISPGREDTSRPPGENLAGPWYHYTLTPPTNWFADVRHRCHPFWITRTKFWN